MEVKNESWVNWKEDSSFNLLLPAPYGYKQSHYHEWLNFLVLRLMCA